MNVWPLASLALNSAFYDVMRASLWDSRLFVWVVTLEFLQDTFPRLITRFLLGFFFRFHHRFLQRFLLLFLLELLSMFFLEFLLGFILKFPDGSSYLNIPWKVHLGILLKLPLGNSSKILAGIAKVVSGFRHSKLQIQGFLLGYNKIFIMGILIKGDTAVQ